MPLKSANQSQPKSSQLSKFRQAAREAGADEDEEAFKRRLRKIAKAPPPNDAPKESKKKPAK